MIKQLQELLIATIYPLSSIIPPCPLDCDLTIHTRFLSHGKACWCCNGQRDHEKGRLQDIWDMINKQTAIDEKLCKLEMLCIKIHGAVETPKKHRITGNYLLKWQEKLKEAATDGDEVLFSFRRRALEEASRDTNHQIATLCALAYTKIAMSSMVSYFQNAAKMLLLCNEEVQKLNSTMERLERLSADIVEFLGLVDLEDLMEEEHAPAKRRNRWLYVTVHRWKRKSIDIQTGRGHLTPPR